MTFFNLIEEEVGLTTELYKLIWAGTSSRVEHFDRIASYFMTQSVLKLEPIAPLGGLKFKVKSTINKSKRVFAEEVDGQSVFLVVSH